MAKAKTKAWSLNALSIDVTHVGGGDYVIKTRSGGEMFISYEAIQELYDRSRLQNSVPILIPGQEVTC